MAESSSKVANQGHRSALGTAFLMTMRKQAEGVLTKFLFGESWDQHILESPFYSVTNAEIEAISFALNHRLLNRLPPVIQFVEYGAGGNTGVAKPKHLIKALIAGGHSVLSYIAIDTEKRYVLESCQAIVGEFNKKHQKIHTKPIVGDFMSNSKMDVPSPLPGAVPLIGIFGRTLSNAPNSSISGGKNSQQNCADYVALIRDRHRNSISEEMYLLLTYHEETDCDSLLREYTVTPQLTAFVLSSFPKVVEKGIITDSDYCYQDYWTVTPIYDDKDQVVKLYAQCLKDHLMPTIEGDIHIKAGERFAHVLSSKWKGQIYQQICLALGASEVQLYKDPKKPTGVMLARFSSGSQIAAADENP
jgi:uncharacterized SAM-dependent methyltransferase